MFCHVLPDLCAGVFFVGEGRGDEGGTPPEGGDECAEVYDVTHLNSSMMKLENHYFQTHKLFHRSIKP